MKAIDDSWYVKPEKIKKRTAAGGVVARECDGRVLIAMGTQDGHPGFVLPKGGVEDGETILEAAHREITEEAGFTELVQLVDLGTRSRLNGAKSCWVTQHFFLFVTSQIDVVPEEEHRHGQPQWFDINDLPSMCWPEQKELLQTHRDRIVELVQSHVDA